MAKGVRIQPGLGVPSSSSPSTGTLEVGPRPVAPIAPAEGAGVVAVVVGQSQIQGHPLEIALECPKTCAVPPCEGLACLPITKNIALHIGLRPDPPPQPVQRPTNEGPQHRQGSVLAFLDEHILVEHCDEVVKVQGTHILREQGTPR
eukprot:893657-Alexandrium_andersonii.AAC.1